MLDDAALATARRFVESAPPPGRLLVCAITGSHIYGFSSPDSDIDIKGIHLAPTESLLGLGAPNETHDRLTVFEGVECDLTTHEAGKALSLLLKGNGNMLERVFSPLQLSPSPELPALQELAAGSLSRACFNHFAGFFRGMQRENLRQDPPHAKSLLYTYRVALTGIHLLRTGEVLCHLPALAEAHGVAAVSDLIAIKQSTAEKATLTPAQAEQYRALWPRLEELLVEARDSSPLPEDAPNRAECDAWLVELRRAAL